jgi:hypothetical protein
LKLMTRLATGRTHCRWNIFHTLVLVVAMSGASMACSERGPSVRLEEPIADAAATGPFGSEGSASQDPPSDAGDAAIQSADALDALDASPDSAAVGMLTFESIMADYRTWRPRAAAPEPISAYIFGLCRLPTPHEQAFSESEHGRERYVLDWANDAAAPGFAAQGAPPFAAGATIVKEKLLPSAGGGFVLAALGIMTKRQPGFDAASGDWEYGYWEPQSGLIRTPALTAHCNGCHAGAADTDFVFFDAGGWLRQ